MPKTLKLLKGFQLMSTMVENSTKDQTKKHLKILETKKFLSILCDETCVLNIVKILN